MLYLVIPVVVLVLVYLYITRNYNHWKNNGVPFEKPEFYFGNLKDVLNASRHIAIVYADLYKKFRKYPYSGYYKLTQPGVILHDLELIKNVVVKDFNSFAHNDFQIEYDIDPIWGSNAFVQVGETWKKTRNAWTSSLTQSRLKALYESISNTADVMVEHIKKDNKEKPNEPHDLRIVSAKFFTDSIVKSVFGLECNSFEKPDNPFMKISQSIFVSNFWEGLVFLIFLIAPGFARLIRLTFIQKSIKKTLLEVSKPILQVREKNGFQKLNPLDSILLFKGPDNISEIEVAGIVFGFLLDGTETSSGVGGFLLYSLGANMDVQKKLQREIDEAYENNGGKFDFQTVHDLPYLDMVINETMRIYPALLNFQRICTSDYELPPIKGSKPVKITKGMTAIIPVIALHMDPELFPDPEKFDPERFSDESKDKIPKYAYMPFGDGPRVCLGIRFGLNQLKIFVANLIRNFEIRLTPEMIGKPIKIDPNIFVYRSVDNLMGTLHTRNFDK